MKSPKEVWSQAVELVSKMTLQERASLMSGSSFWHLQPIERLGLDAIMVADGPHGLRKADMAVDQAGLNASVPATCFPTAVTLASSWDIDLLQEVGAAIGTAEATSVFLCFFFFHDELGSILFGQSTLLGCGRGEVDAGSEVGLCTNTKSGPLAFSASACLSSNS